MKGLLPLLCLLLLAPLVQAESRIAVVDLREALLQSNAARSFGEELKGEFADEERRLKTLGDEATQLQERLKTDGAIMSEDERSKLSVDLENKAQEFNFLKQKYQQAITKREEMFLKSSRPKLDAAIRQIAEKGGYSLILPANVAIYSTASDDITPQLIEALNASQ